MPAQNTRAKSCMKYFIMYYVVVHSLSWMGGKGAGWLVYFLLWANIRRCGRALVRIGEALKPGPPMMRGPAPHPPPQHRRPPVNLVASLTPNPYAAIPVEFPQTLRHTIMSFVQHQHDDCDLDNLPGVFEDCVDELYGIRKPAVKVDPIKDRLCAIARKNVISRPDKHWLRQLNDKGCPSCQRTLEYAANRFLDIPKAPSGDTPAPSASLQALLKKKGQIAAKGAALKSKRCLNPPKAQQAPVAVAPEWTTPTEEGQPRLHLETLDLIAEQLEPVLARGDRGTTLSLAAGLATSNVFRQMQADVKQGGRGLKLSSDPAFAAYGGARSVYALAATNLAEASLARHLEGWVPTLAFAQIQGRQNGVSDSITQAGHEWLQVQGFEPRLLVPMWLYATKWVLMALSCPTALVLFLLAVAVPLLWLVAPAAFCLPYYAFKWARQPRFTQPAQRSGNGDAVAALLDSLKTRSTPKSVIQDFHRATLLSGSQLSTTGESSHLKPKKPLVESSGLKWLSGKCRVLIVMVFVVLAVLLVGSVPMPPPGHSEMSTPPLQAGSPTSSPTLKPPPGLRSTNTLALPPPTSAYTRLSPIALEASLIETDFYGSTRQLRCRRWPLKPGQTDSQETSASK